MSDARNSSNSLRGGGAKQTGGAGRTQKYAVGNRKTELLGQQGLQAHQERSEAKRKLQLQVTSKKLAADMRAALLMDHTEEEYEEYQIPLPSTEDAKKKLKAMKEFTEKWYDKDFREEWLQTVTEVWLEELRAKYEAAVLAAKLARDPPKQEEGEAMSIEELTELIANLDPDTPPEERQRLKKKLKRKKQRARDKEKAKAAAENETTATE
mmetsp:Transcript_5210/g.13216  ORF Transcript_5210/g.13216 Transcript_5210/m.13216 type:complete len:210 (-) Transcript_5210:372-1001(-)|eukprot:CAMPEP_0197183744 /NCGR_PEP_ID=MMETSP1423-20130617/8195_1 /TAXON_ID=476441 /ORGANISM="Pseudo-nitzschia heimii, Strain UNC1101" /LENGTH=209 /DNA_ID=CAMNT_0042634361 /DNA_START=160 /DNA_END=789 /DNA_ORIENTATION=-